MSRRRRHIAAAIAHATDRRRSRTVGRRLGTLLVDLGREQRAQRTTPPGERVEVPQTRAQFIRAGLITPPRREPEDAA